MTEDEVVKILADTITKIEGTYPPGSRVGGVLYQQGSLAWRNNNPGNLIYLGVRQCGETGVQQGLGGFAKFPSPESGRRALEWQVRKYIDLGYDINQFIDKWAPANTKNQAGAAQTERATHMYKLAVGEVLKIPVEGVQVKSLIGIKKLIGDKDASQIS